MGRMKGGRSREAHRQRVSLLFPERIAEIARLPPQDRNFSMRVLNRWAVAREHEELELPVKLNPEKGSEGPLARDYNMNSSRPMISKMSGSLACYNKSLSYEEDFVAITHPDRTMQSPDHSVLRLASLATLSPDPFTYSLLSLLFQGVVAQYNVDLDRIPLKLEEVEANGTLYQLNEAGAVHEVVRSKEEDFLSLRFPSFGCVLSLHGLAQERRVWAECPTVLTIVPKILTDIKESYLGEGMVSTLAHDGATLFDTPVPRDLRGELEPIGSRSSIHFTKQYG